jgi:hypothetical protein
MGPVEPNPPSQLWPMVAQLCRVAPSRSWCVIGDCNVTLAAVETAASSSVPNPNRAPYQAFLRDARGCDLWSAWMIVPRFPIAHALAAPLGPFSIVWNCVAYSHTRIVRRRWG